MARVNAVACSQLQGVGTRGVGSDVAVNVARLWGAGRSALSTHYGYGMDIHLEMEEETLGNHE